MSSLSRRGLIQALTAAAGLMTRPGAAAAKAAMSIAEAPGFSVLAAALPRDGISSELRGAAPHISSDSKHSLATRAAMQILDRRCWQGPENFRVRAEIECFRSASPVNKARWEEEARDDDVDRKLKYQQVLEWLHEGKIKL